MREILFRGKRTHTNEWIEGSLIYRPENFTENENEYAAIILFDKGSGSSHDAYLELQVIPETVGQFTGLTDKNGVKIFEGDIVTYHFATEFGRQVRPKTVISYNQKELRFEAKGRTSNMHNLKDLEVIGNIHENPNNSNQ